MLAARLFLKETSMPVRGSRRGAVSLWWRASRRLVAERPQRNSHSDCADYPFLHKVINWIHIDNRRCQSFSGS
jgi:hypothetical protein